MEKKTNRKRLIKVLALCLGLSVAQVSHAQDWKKYIVPTVIAAGVVVTSFVLYKIFKSSAKEDKPVEIDKNKQEKVKTEQPQQSSDEQEETPKIEKEEKKDNEVEAICDKYKEFRESVYKWLEKAENIKRGLGANRLVGRLLSLKKWDNTKYQETTENMGALKKKEKKFWEKLVNKHGFEKLMNIFSSEKVESPDVLRKNTEVKKQIMAAKERLEK